MNMSMQKFIALMFGMALIGSGETLLLVHFELTPNNIFRLGLTFLAIGMLVAMIAIWGHIIRDKLSRR